MGHSRVQVTCFSSKGRKVINFFFFFYRKCSPKLPRTGLITVRLHLTKFNDSSLSETPLLIVWSTRFSLYSQILTRKFHLNFLLPYPTTTFLIPVITERSKFSPLFDRVSLNLWLQSQREGDQIMGVWGVSRYDWSLQGPSSTVSNVGVMVLGGLLGTDFPK